MSRIRPSWVPGLTDQSGNFTIGHRWSASAPVTVDGAWYYRGSGDTPPTGLTAILYDFLTEAVLASGSVGAPPEGWSFVPFASSYEAASGVDYVTAVETDGRYGFELDAGFPITDPGHGLVTIPSNGAAFEFGHVFPGSFWAGMHGTDTEFEPTSVDPSSGQAHAAVGVDLAVTGGRASAGAAVLAVGADLAVAGGRPALGSAAPVVGVRLEVAGWTEAGRSVTPFPSPARPVETFPVGGEVESFPYAPRPVRSFSEVPTP